MQRRITVILVLAALVIGCQTARPAKKSEAAAVRAPGGTLALMINVMGAEVRIDGTLWGNAVRPYPDANQFNVSAGRHNIVVSSPGYASYETSVEIMPGNMHSYIVNLRPLSGADFARLREEQATERMFVRSAELLINSDVGGAMVHVDGLLRGQVPTISAHGNGFELSMMLPVGPHVLLLKKEGYKEYRTEIYVNERSGIRLAIVMEPEEKAAE